MQRGMLFHSLLDPDAGQFVTQLTCRIEADLDVPAFERAWNAVVERHPALRTAFVWEGVDSRAGRAAGRARAVRGARLARALSRRA